MPDDRKVTRIDSDRLNSLVKRFVQLRQELKETARQRDEFLIKYRNPNNGNQEDDGFYATDKDTITRHAAIKQLSALLCFLGNDEGLVPELRKLSLALADLGNGRTVKWLHPAPKQPACEWAMI